MARAYARIPIFWLYDRRICQLSDSDYRKFVTDFITDPKNIWYEDYRNSWNKVRKKMTKLVMERDPHECRYCGSIKKLEIDHIHPMVRGGTNNLDNLQILCKPCNMKKSAKVGYE